jgi:hypothetical protein
MFDSQILDTAIGLVFIYFFLSILCSAIIEIVASLTKKRSRMLGIGILALIQDPDALKNFYQQPFFMGKTAPGDIFKSLWDSIVPLPSWKKRTPSYISSRSFVLSLLESLKQHPDVVTKLLKDRIAPPKYVNEIKGFTEKVKRLPDESIIKQELEKVLASARADTDDVVKKVEEWYTTTSHCNELILKEVKFHATGDYLSDVRTLLDALSDHNALKKALLPLLDISGDNIEKAFDSIEKWYDEGMERVTGWYKKYSQIFAIILAVIVALVLNADSFEMGKALYRDNVLRASLVTMASDRVNPPAQLPANAGSASKGDGRREEGMTKSHGAVATSSSVDAGKQLPQTGSVSSEVALTTESGKPTSIDNNDLNKKVEQINKDFRQISSINLPIGWPIKIDSKTKIEDIYRQITELPFTPEKILGILITALMVSMGSNFWYELLSKLLNVRSTGKKPLTNEEQETRKMQA